MPGWGLVPTYVEVWKCHGGISTLFCRKIPHYFHTFHTTVFRAKTIFSLCINDLRNHTKSWHADCDIISEPAKEWRHNEAAQQNN